MYPDWTDTQVEVNPEQGLWLALPTYVIIRKLEYFREGRSQKNLLDIEKMLSQIEPDLTVDLLNEEFEMCGLELLGERSFMIFTIGNKPY